MKKSIRRRLEKALTILKEPGGSTIRSIIKTVNKETPILSLRKLLEALQEGVEEGFLCMYNGRFKLKQNVHDNSKNDHKSSKNCDIPLEPVDDEGGPSCQGCPKEDAEARDEELDIKNNPKKKSSTRRSCNKAKPVRGNKKKPLKRKPARKGKTYEKGKPRKNVPPESTVESGSTYSITDKFESQKTSKRPVLEKVEVKKQRGPRCTSMKKEIRIPSKVTFPFIVPSAPHRGANFHDLIRKSPERLNGPLYDDYRSFSFAPDKFEFFGTYC